MKKFIPLAVPNFVGNEEKYVLDAVKQGWVSTGGAYILELEEKLSDFLNVEGAVACQSGTSAIHMALMECGVKPDDMVIVPTLTFIAAVNPVKYQFAKPIFMDCDEGLCLDAYKLKEFCEKECSYEDGVLYYLNKQIKAIVVVYIFGNLADMEMIMDIAEKYNLKVIEDATEALGSKYTKGRYAGKYAGTIGDFGAYSFNGNKIITTGGGGAVVAKDKNELKHIRYISTQAKDNALFYIHNEVGYNYRMTNLQAALGVAQLEFLNEFINRKRQNYDLYKELLKSVENVELLEENEGICSNRWFYALRIKTSRNVSDLTKIVESLNERGVQVRPIWGLIHKQLPYKSDVSYNIKKAEEYVNSVINLPCSTNLTKEDIILVVDMIKEVVGGI